jgi:hypothetical protein
MSTPSHYGSITLTDVVDGKNITPNRGQLTHVSYRAGCVSNTWSKERHLLSQSYSKVNPQISPDQNKNIHAYYIHKLLLLLTVSVTVTKTNLTNI